MNGFPVLMLGVSEERFRRLSGYGADMTMMPARRRDAPSADVVLGPCPGCDSWQVDYTDEVAREFAKLQPGPDLGLEVDMAEWYLAIEGVLEEHAAECPHLQDLINAL